MSSTIRWDLDATTDARFASLTSASTATTPFDFGTPDDINLADETTFKPGDRVLVVLTATRAGGTTDTLTFSVQDAPDSSGSIGTPATATISGTVPAFAANSGAVTKGAIVAVQVKPGRPWIRVNAVQAGGGTDSFQCHCAVLGRF